MKRILICIATLFLIFLPPGASFAEEPVRIVQSMSGKWYQVERSNWSQYRNGKYLGLTHRETRTTLTAEPVHDESSRFSGFSYVLEETLRDMRKSARSLDDIHKVSFTMTPDGRMTIAGTDTGHPRLRNFPLLPRDPVLPRDRWEGESVRIVDPYNTGKNTVMPIQVSYQFAGTEQYNGEEVFRIRAKYATRINKHMTIRSDDPALESATGTHDIDILVARKTGAMVLMLDRQDETFYYADGSSIRFRGSTAVFGEVPVPVNRAAIARSASAYGVTEPDEQTFMNPDTSVRESLEPAPFMIEETEQGVRLSLRNIRFVADSAEILPEETWRLDALAETIRAIPEGRLLVEGHTADVGFPAGEKKLSIERAQRIIKELSRRGIAENRCIFTGYGGTRPVADNSTPEGRAQNRRVEITILE